MPYSTQHKQATGTRIVDAARALFNRRGFVGVSIDEIMESAGLTRGGFYNHFASKEELHVEAVQSYTHTNSTERWEEVDLDFNARGAEFARQFVHAYLSRAHLEDIEGQCPMIALPSDVARTRVGVKRAYRGLFEDMARIFEAGAESSTVVWQRGLALSALCVGAMVVARAVDDAHYANEIRGAARDLALTVIAG